MNKPNTREVIIRSSEASIGLGGLCFITLLILKVTELTTLSWFWVFTSLFITPLFIISILSVLGLIALLIVGFVAGFEFSLKLLTKIHKKFFKRKAR